MTEPYQETIGNGRQSSFTIEHGLETIAIHAVFYHLPSLRQAKDNEYTLWVKSTDSIRVDFHHGPIKEDSIHVVVFS